MNIDEGFYLFVDGFSCFFTVWLVKRVLLLTGRVIITDVSNLVTHPKIGDHGKGLLCNPLQVIKGAGGYFFEGQLLRSPSSQCSTHLIQHLFGGGDLSLFRKIPGSSKCFSPGDNGDLYQRMGMFEKPANCSMTRFVPGNGSFFPLFNDLILLFQSPDNAVHCIQEIQSSNGFLIFPCCYQCRFVTDIGNVGP